LQDGVARPYLLVAVSLLLQQMMYRPQPEATENETVADFGIRPLVFDNHSRPFHHHRRRRPHLGSPGRHGRHSHHLVIVIFHGCAVAI
jgi:hypothetical protein